MTADQIKPVLFFEMEADGLVCFEYDHTIQHRWPPRTLEQLQARTAIVCQLVIHPIAGMVAAWWRVFFTQLCFISVRITTSIHHDAAACTSSCAGVRLRG
jgi:hypothetical protein